MAHAPDEKLVRRAQRGDKAAFAELFTRYEGRIFGYLYRMVGDRGWAEDLAQEAFIRAHQHLRGLGPPYDFKSWVYRIAGNLALDGLRRHRREVPLPDWDGGEATAPEPADQRREGDPETQARLSEVRAAVWRAIHQLPDNYRQVLVLREIDGLSYNEIAAVLGISLDNVRVTLHRSRMQFRDLYGIQVMTEEGRRACQGLDDLLSAYADGELDRATHQQIKAHVAACPACQKKQRDLLAISGLLAVLVPIFPPLTLRLRFLDQLKRLPRPEKSQTSTSAHAAGRGGGGGGGHWPLALAAGGTAAVLLVAAILVAGVLIIPRLGAIPPLTTASPTTPPTALPSPTSAATETTAPLPTQTQTPIPATSTLIPTATPTPTPTPTPVPPTPTPTSSIAFWADATTVPAGTCTTIHWQTENVQAVYLDGSGVAGTGSQQTCPCEGETHTLEVTMPDGSREVRTVTIGVTGTCITPTPDNQPPPAPRPIAPSGGIVLSCRTSAALSWRAVSDPSGIAGYHVRLEQGEGNKWQPVDEWGPVTGTSLDVPVSCGLAYRWSVRAVDNAGNQGPWSMWVQFGIGID